MNFNICKLSPNNKAHGLFVKKLLAAKKKKERSQKQGENHWAIKTREEGDGVDMN